ncbi:hypothetical protein [Selenomonas ruminantium]|uniref:hypothetical protein n=1 Tax=Selenomonas ruminantium TaxID=971 RepID=UPI0026F1B507|nr:hypothetical protein [Selenomonas ruminantium]
MKGEFLGYIMNKMISGGISGAITNTESAEALAHAIKDYEKIRNDEHDVEKIVENTGMKEIQIKYIKDYLFYDKHKMNNGEIKRFDPNFRIAQSWHRLAYEPQNIQEHDMLLLKHETMEFSLLMLGYEQEEAHNITNEKYNYTEASDKYYERLRLAQKRKHKETPITLAMLKEFDKKIAEANKREDAKKNKNRGGR